MSKQRSRPIYLLQILVGCSVISVFNPASTGWQFSLVAIPAGIFLTVTAYYGLAHGLSYRQLPLWARILSLLGIIGFCAALLLLLGLRLLFTNFTF